MSEILQNQLQWHKKASQGCVFAATLAAEGRAAESGLFREVITTKLSPELISEIATFYKQKVADLNTILLSLIIPDIDSEEKLLVFLSLIKQHTDWGVDDSEVYENFRLVKLRIPLDENDEDGEPILSWALFFGNLNFFPKTRQSPYFEFVVSVKSRYFLKNKYARLSLTQQNAETENRGGSSTDAHLADVYIDGITNVGLRDKRTWKNTREMKRQILTDFGSKPFDDTRAKAKVTCSYPI